MVPSPRTGMLSKQVAVFGNHIGQGLDDGLGAFVAVAIVDTAVVVPRADAGVGLPGMRLDGVALAALDVPDHRFALLFVQNFAEEHRFQLAAMSLHVGVVEVGGDFQSGIADGPERKRGVVEIDQIGVVFVNRSRVRL